MKMSEIIVDEDNDDDFRDLGIDRHWRHYQTMAKRRDGGGDLAANVGVGKEERWR